MQCSGAWDWAPYGTTLSTTGSHTFTKGIHKDVYLVPVTSAAISAVVPQLMHAGPYPVTSLEDGKETFAPLILRRIVKLPLPLVCVGGRVSSVVTM